MRRTNEYLDTLNAAVLGHKKKLTKETERRIIRIYSQAIEDLQEELEYSTNEISDEFIKGRIEALEDEIDHIVRESVKEAASGGLYPHDELLKKVSPSKGIYASITADFQNIPTEALRILASGELYKDNRTLSERIWSYTNYAGTQVNEVIAAGLSKGMSAMDLAKLLEDFVNPESRTYWTREKIREKLGDGYAGGQPSIEYNALRLARTSISHSFSLGNRLAAKENPFISSIRWHSVFAHGRTCEECMEMDGNVYSIDELPFDHPNGMCWEEPIYTKTLEEMQEELEMMV